MKIHLYSVCWNEELLAKHFVNYYSQFCEKITIFDNNSTDKTVEKLKETNKVDIITYHTDGFRDDINRDIKNKCWKESIGVADYVIVCDFDEFLYHKNIFKFLEDNKNYTLFHPDIYDMVTDINVTDEIDLFNKVQEGYLVEDIYNQKMNKCILFNPNKFEEINYSEGSHRLYNPKGNLNLYNNINNFDLKLLHYKYLSLNYTLKRKNELCKRLSDFNLSVKWGVHNCQSDEHWTNRFNNAKNKSINVFNI